MNLAIVTFTGFTESDAQRTGTEDLYFDIIRKYSGETVTTYQPREWTTDIKKLAYQINRQGIRNVAMISYSHGQAAACDFARECYKLGIAVDLWVACDPVYRPSWLWRKNWTQPVAFRALFKNSKITVPSNIQRVTGARQNISIPCGHDMRTSLGTTLIPLIYLPYSHAQIDGSPEWFAIVKQELDHLIVDNLTV